MGEGVDGEMRKEGGGSAGEDRKLKRNEQAAFFSLGGHHYSIQLITVVHVAMSILISFQ